MTRPTICRRTSRALCVLLLAALITACGQLASSGAPTAVPTASQPTSAPVAGQPTAPAAVPPVDPSRVTGELVIYSGRSEPLIAPVLDRFRALNPGINIQLKAGSNGELAAALAEEAANPQADVFISTDMMTVASLGAQGLLAPLSGPQFETVPAQYRNLEAGWISFTGRARVIMYNKDQLAAEEVPTSVFELTDPKWKGRIAAAGATNGSMQAHVAAIIETQGLDAARAWLEGMVANEVQFFGGHTDVRKAVGMGEFAIGLVNHYYYHLQAAEASDNNVGVVYPDQGDGQMGLVLNTTAGGIINDARHPEAARAFLEFLLTDDAQYLFAQLNYEYPLLPSIKPAEGVRPLDGLRLAPLDLKQQYADLATARELLLQVGVP